MKNPLQNTFIFMIIIGVINCTWRSNKKYFCAIAFFAAGNKNIHNVEIR